MSVINKNLGARIAASLGRAGERPDLKPAVIVGRPEMTAVNGRMGLYAEIVFVQKNLSGEEYLAQRIHNLAFAFDRKDLHPLLDGTEQAPKSWQEVVKEQSASALAFAMGRPEGAPIQSLNVTETLAATE